MAATPSLFPREIATYMPQARDAVVEAIAAASSKRPIGLPEHLLAYFDTFGRNLGESESIEFPGARTEQLAKLNKLTRRALLLASAGIDEWTDVTEVRGLVPEADQGRKSFEVELTDGRKISGPLTAQHRVQLLEAFNGYANRQRVAIDCIGRFNRSNQIVGIDSIEQVTLLDPLDISARIDDLRNLRDGWLNGDGKAPNPTHLWRLEHLFESHYPDTIVPPHLYPTPEGNVSAEWSLPPHEVSAEIDVATLACHVHLLDLETDRDRTEELNLAGEPGWARLVALIGELPGGRL
ncbi:MAG TPA: hypothetical protein VMD30_01505 [Tepidisphaeraceae bacterium]|nr:hypothetical protein [Tepidisphaeraceae bacterium]